MDGTRQGSLSRGELVGATAVLTFGSTALVAVLGSGSLSAVIFVLGFFILVPMLVIFGDRLSVVESEAEDEAAPGTTRSDVRPVERLRERYARGEISEAEFERKLERLLETEGLAGRVDDRERSVEPE